MRCIIRILSFTSALAPLILLTLLCLLFSFHTAAAQDNESCLDCHDDDEMTSEDGRFVGVVAAFFAKSIHGDMDCVDCHAAPGDYDDEPHWASYTPVDCAECHEDESHSYQLNHHFKSRQSANGDAPTCASCHALDGNAHRIVALDDRPMTEGCVDCHRTVASSYGKGVHAGRDGPDCLSCHESHGPGTLRVANITEMCTDCHDSAWDDLMRAGHAHENGEIERPASCASCHDAHDTHSDGERLVAACASCHEDQHTAFAGSTHEDLQADGDMTCLSCHHLHKDEIEITRLDSGCGDCHFDELAEYATSVHRFARLQGQETAASCADCHDSHNALAASDSTSSVHIRNIPNLCAKCHTDEPAITEDFVRLPVRLPNYLDSVHGMGWVEGKRTAVCTDCHGVHDLRKGHEPGSHVHRMQIAETCGQCHEEISNTFQASVHGRAVAMGIYEAPTCTDCHDEHLIKAHGDDGTRVSPEALARQLCGNCHTNPEMIAKFGIQGAVLDTYLDSYHAWAVDRGSSIAATCTDCHTVHDIRSPLDPASSVHDDNVTATCGTCHKNSNPAFALSYTHVSALQARGPHGWVRLIYIGLIAFVLGGMALHNLIVARFELKKHFKHRRHEPYIQRWQRAERLQHLALLLSFSGLAITGFALRFPDSWWVKLIGLGGHELIRAWLHRALAIIMSAVAVYHTIWLLITRRGRGALSDMAPTGIDLLQFIQNMMFHLGLRKTRPEFKRFDYTQKAEYWAVVWGTVVMALTGFVLWFPAVATGLLPPWVVRVSEVVHFYEAVLAVAAIVIWHFFYVIFMPGEYPVSTIWLNGRMPAEHWQKHHAGAAGTEAIRNPDPYGGTGDMNLSGSGSETAPSDVKPGETDDDKPGGGSAGTSA